MAISPLMNELARYIARAPRRPLPAKVVEATKQHALDTLAAMVSGARLPAGRIAISFVKSLAGTPEATVIGSKCVTSVVDAALANGMSAHADETDDSHAPSLTHPGCGVVAAALAMGERERSTGAAWLRAVALGYDICARLSLSLHADRFHALGHTTHSFGPLFGAAAAGAALAGLDARRIRHVLSYAAQQASGLSTYARDTGHIEKAFDFGGMPGRNGVAAAAMVAAGCTAVEDVFSGERNFFVAFDESRRLGHKPAPEILVRELGTTYEIANTNIKRWSVGSPIQAALDSLLALIDAHAIDASEVERVVVRISQIGANTCSDRDMPDICLQHLCAVMLIDGGLTFITAHDEPRMRDPRVLAVRRRIELIGDPVLEKLLPSRQAVVAVTLADGRQFHHRTTAVRGTAENPMTRGEVDAKCFDLMAPVLGAKRARSLCDTIWRCERVPDVRALRPLLQA
jgi:2-methylcitrate dehydratase PrpD